MDLVKARNSAPMDTLSAGTIVPLTATDQVLANVSTMTIGYEAVDHVVRAYGNMEIAEPNKTVISARFNGRIERLYIDASGAKVKAGDSLFDVYSPDIVQASNEYIQATRSTVTGQANMSLFKSKLELLGLTGDQIRELESTGVTPLVMTYHSPASGTVIEKKIVKGAYVTEGTSLYEIADMSRLWNTADLYEADAGHISTGEPASITTAAYPNTTFKAKVVMIYPIVNPQSRTVKVRLVVDNALGRLRPNMYTETVFSQTKGRSLTVPASAVLVTGKRNIVYVKVGHEDHFQARDVSLGSRFADKYEITAGLQEGDVVVTQGGYLIDSESQLKTGSGAAHQHGGLTPKSEDETAPSPHKH
jgi:Cu(I)/Ag(I) efflux system membrane fusion protein